MRQTAIIFAVIFGFCFPCWSEPASTNPFSDESNVSQTKKVAPPEGSVNQVAISSSSTSMEPTPPSDPLASATSDGKAAHQILADAIAKLKEHVQKKDNKKTAQTLAYIEKISKDTRVKGKKVLGLNSRMKAGGVDVSAINELRGKLASLKSQAYNQQAGALVAKARDYEGFNTSKGPGGGNVACAWFVSIILRAAGIVPQGWNDNLALGLTQRMQKDFGWNKVPSTGKAYSGKISSKSMKPGDIVFFSPSEHVGVYLGGGMVISNSSTTARGTIHPVSGYYDGWTPRFVVRPPGSNA